MVTRIIRWGMMAVLGSLPMAGCGSSDGNGQDDAITDKTIIVGISIVSAPRENGTYGKSEMIMAEVAFSAYVTVSGTPHLALQIGGQVRQATYRSGSGTKTLRFGYVVQSADRSSQGITIATNPLSMNGGDIVNGNGNGISLNIYRYTITNATGHNVDGSVYLPPKPVNMRTVSRPIQGDTYGATEIIKIEIEFDEEVTVTGRPSLALAIGGQTRQAYYEGGGGTPKLVFGYIVADSDRDDDGIAISGNALSMNGGSVLDADGNGPEPIPGDLIDAAFGGAENLKVDGSVDHPPVVVDVRITSSPIRGDVYGVTELIEIDVVFSESVVVRGHPTLDIGLGPTVRQVMYRTGYRDESFSASVSLPLLAHLQVQPDLYNKNTHSLTFLYTVEASDHDPDGMSIAKDALTLAGGEISDAGGNHAHLSLGDHAIVAATDHKVDGGIDHPPFVTDVSIPSSPLQGDTYGIYESIDVVVRFSEPVAIRKSDGAMGSPSAPSVGRPSVKLTLDSSEEPVMLGVHYPEWEYPEINARLYHEHRFILPGNHPDGFTSETSRVSLEGERGSLSGYHLDLDGISILADALVLNGGTIQDVHGNNAELDIGTHAIINAAGHKVDTTKPSAYVVPTSIGVNKFYPIRAQHNIENHPDDDYLTYRTGDLLEINFALRNSNISGVSASGSPTLVMKIGSKIRRAKLQSYSSGNPIYDVVHHGDVQFYFEYVIAPDDFTANSIEYMAIDGGEILDQDGRPIEMVFTEDHKTNYVDVFGEDDIAYIGSASLWAQGQTGRIVVTPFGYDWHFDHAFGEPLIIAIQASEPVVVEGTPLLELTIGSKTRFAQYRASEDYSELGHGDGTYLFFSYDVHPSDLQREPIRASSKSLEEGGGTITTRSGNPIDLSLSAYVGADYGGGVNGGLVRDAALSWARMAPQLPEGKILHPGEHIYLWVHFSKGVEFTEEPYAELIIGWQTRRLSLYKVDAFSQGAGLLFRYTITESDFGRIGMPEDPIRGALTDSSGASVQIDLGWRPWGDGDIFADGNGGGKLPLDPLAIDGGGGSIADPSGDHTAEAFPSTARTSSYACQAASSGSPNAVMSGLPDSGNAPLRLSLDATGSSSGDGVRLISHSWYLNASVVLHDGPGPHTVVLPPGNHRIQLDVTDANGNSDCIEKAIAVGVGDGAAYDVDVYDDRVITIDIADIQDVLNPRDDKYRGQFIEHLSWVLYTYFQDDFDFLLFLFNTDPSDPFTLVSSRRGVRAEYHAVQNSIAGLGPSRNFYSSHFDDTTQFGSEGRLQGTAIFGDRTMLWDGTGLHEILHRWGNYMIPTADEYGWRHHWGLSNAYGQLGGFDLRYLERAPKYNDIYGNAYQIAGGGFSPHGAWIPGREGPIRYVDVYSPLELYLMGLVPIEDVPTIWTATRAFELELGRVGIPDNVFVVSEWAAYDQDRILREFGPRNPPHGQAQTEFKAAAVLLSTDRFPLTAEDLRQVSQGVQAFSHGGDDGMEDRTNFWEATGGRATMEMGRLGLSRKAVPTPPTAIPPTHAAFERLRRGEGIKVPPIH